MAASSRSVLRDLASLHVDVRVRLDVDLAAARDRDVLALDRDRSILLQGDARVSRLEQDLVTGDEGELLADLDLVVLANLNRGAPSDLKRFVLADALGTAVADRQALVLADIRGAVAADRDRLVLVYRLRSIGMDRDCLVLFYRLGPVVLDVSLLVVVDRLGAIVPDPVRLVHLNLDILIPLGVDEDLLVSFLVLESDLVVIRRAAAERAAALDAALRLVGGKVVRRHALSVVDAADDDWLGHVSFEEVDHDLLADAGNVNRAPALAGPWRHDPDPAGAVAVLLAFPVPVELHLDARILVREDLLASGPDDDRRLRPPHRGDRRDARRAEGQGGWEAGEVVLIREPASVGTQVGGFGRGVLELVDDPRTVSLEMALERELVARDDLAAVARGVHEDAGGRL